MSVVTEMTCEISFKISKKFRQVLAQTNHRIISRNDLIKLVIKETELSQVQATGLVDRGVHQLKAQGLATSIGQPKNIFYEFASEVRNPSLFCYENDSYDILTKEKKILEKGILLVQYELQAYEELLERIPKEKSKIIKLQKNTLEHLNKLNGQLRAVEQLLTL